MPYEISRGSDHTLEISGSLDVEVVHSQRELISRKLRSHAAIPGFRKGKAPVSAIRVRFAEEISEELKEDLVSTVWREIVDQEEDFYPLTSPQFDRMEFVEDGSFEFKAHMEVRPVWDLPAVEGIEVEEIPLEVSEDEIEGELAKLQEEQASWVPAEEDAVASDGMLVECDLKTKVGEDEEENLQEGAQILVGSDAIPAEIHESLQGARPGDVRQASHRRDPEDDESPLVQHEIEVKDLKVKTLPEIDEDLAKALEFDTVEELRERIREVLLQQKASDRRESIRRRILDVLETDLDLETLPPTLVKNAVAEDMQRFAYSLAMRGEKMPEDMDWEQLQVQMTPGARKRVMDTLVLEQLVREWEVPVPEKDVEMYIRAEAQRKGVPVDEHKATLEKEDRLDQIRHGALMSAVVGEMFSRAGIPEES